MSADDQKRAAALAALEHVQDGMVVGLGTGSTAKHFVEGLGQRVAEGLRVTGVPTSVQTEDLAKAAGVPLADLNALTGVDLTVDGADEADPQGRLIKGGGAALLREKIVASASDAMIVIADASKRVDVLGRFPLPVEVATYAHGLTARAVDAALRAAGVEAPAPALRRTGAGEPVLTDGGNLIYDCPCGRIPDPDDAADRLSAIPGVVEHGLFIGLASLMIFGLDHAVEIVDAGPRR